jgi:3-oxoacyl-[acyl-carrier-protein] synthase-3
MSMRRALITGCGSCLPRQAVTNQELIERGIDTSDEWIVQRTGITQRYIAGPDERTSDLATEAAKRAIENAGLTAADIDLIICASVTQDNTLPAMAAKVQANLGVDKGFAFDMSAVCSGFVYALSVANSLITTGQANHAIVIGAETLSRILDWKDRSTCVLFGDGAGAVVLSGEEENGDLSDRGILGSQLHADGRYYDSLYADGGPGSTQTVGLVRMSGKEVFKQAVTCLSSVVDEVLHNVGISSDQVDWLVPHQANLRIIEGTAKKLKMPMDRVIVTVDKHANTSAASIPLALAAANAEGKFKKGQLILLDAMGAGFTWGAAVLRW